jgi:hypothetical protein
MVTWLSSRPRSMTSQVLCSTKHVSTGPVFGFCALSCNRPPTTFRRGRDLGLAKPFLHLRCLWAAHQTIKCQEAQPASLTTLSWTPSILSSSSHRPVAPSGHHARSGAPRSAALCLPVDPGSCRVLQAQARLWMLRFQARSMQRVLLQLRWWLRQPV